MDVLGIHPIVELAVDSILLHRKQAVHSKSPTHVITSTSFRPQLNICHRIRLPELRPLPEPANSILSIWGNKNSVTLILEACFWAIPLGIPNT